MAFVQANLSKIVELGAPGGSIWSYTTTDASATVYASGYFTGTAVSMLRVGDLIIRRTVSAVPIVDGSTTVTTWGVHVVLTNDGTTVDVSDPMLGVVTNT